MTGLLDSKLLTVVVKYTSEKVYCLVVRCNSIKAFKIEFVFLFMIHLVL